MFGKKKSTVAPLHSVVVDDHTKALNMAEVEYKIHYERVVSGILAFVRKTWKGEAFVGPFCRHMAGMGWNKLDEYNDIVIHLPSQEGGGKLHFVTSLYKGGQFTYTIGSYDAEVPVDMKKRTFLGFEV